MSRLSDEAAPSSQSQSAALWKEESDVSRKGTKSLFQVTLLELLPLACSEAVNPKKTIPRAFLLSFTVIAINALLLVIAVGCNAPGNVAVSLDFDTPLYHVFMSGLHVSKQVAKALVLPAMFATAVVFGYKAKLHPATTAGSDRGHDLKSHEGQKNCDNTSDLLILEGGNPSLHFDMSTSVHYGRSSCFSLNNGANNGKSIDGWAAMALQQNLGMKEREYEACLLDEDARSSQDVDGKAIEQFDINTRLNLNFPASKRVGSTDLIDDTVKVKATHCRVYQSDKMREDVESEENENPSSLRHRTVASRRHSVVCPLDNRGYSFPVLSARHGFQQVDDGPQEMDEVVHLAEEVSKIRSRDLPHLLQRSFSRMLAKLSGSRSLDYGYEGYEVLLEGEDALSPLPRVGSSHKEVEEVSENGCDRQSFLN
eukprot:gene8314-9166_t